MASKAILDAYKRGEKARNNAKKKGVVTTQPTQKKKPTNKQNNQTSKPKTPTSYKKTTTQTTKRGGKGETDSWQAYVNKNVFGGGTSRQDLQSAYERGKNTSGLGTKIKTKTYDTGITAKDQKKAIKDQKAQYYGSKDWKTAKEDIKKANRKAWRDALKEAGYNEKQSKEWMNSEQGKEYRKDSYYQMKDSMKGAVNESVKDSVKKNLPTKGKYKALNRDEYLKLQNAERLTGGKKIKNAALGKDLSKKVGALNAKDYAKDAGVIGALEGSNPLPVSLERLGSGKTTAGQKATIAKAKESGAYKAGYAVGMASSFALNRTGAMGKGLAQAGKGVAKTTAGRIARNVAGDAIVSSPLNFTDAIKNATDANGKVNVKQAAALMGINTAFDVGIGGAIEGAGAAFTKASAKNLIKLQAKANVKGLTKEESDKLAKLYDRLNKVKNDTQSSGQFIAGKGYTNAKDLKTAGIENTANEIADNARKAQGGETVNVGANIKATEDTRMATTKANNAKVDEITTNARINDLDSRIKKLSDIAKGSKDESAITVANNNIKKLEAEKRTLTDSLNAKVDTENINASDATITQGRENVASGEKVAVKDRENPTGDLTANADAARNVKEEQLKIINKTNPANDDLHVWIRNADDIKKFDEAVNSEEAVFTPDYDSTMANKAIETGKIQVYSSKPIEDGAFVSPSKQIAKDYAGEGKIYSKTMKLDDVAWVDSLEGQVAKLSKSDTNVKDSNKSAKKIDAKIRGEEVHLKNAIKKYGADSDRVSEIKSNIENLKTQANEIRNASKTEGEKIVDEYKIKNLEARKAQATLNGINEAIRRGDNIPEAKLSKPKKTAPNTHGTKITPKAKTNYSDDLIDETNKLKKEKQSLEIANKKSKTPEHFADREARLKEIEEREIAISNALDPKIEKRSKLKEMWVSTRRLFESSLIGLEREAKKITDVEERNKMLDTINNVIVSKNRAAGWVTEKRTGLDRKILGNGLDDIFAPIMKNKEMREDFDLYSLCLHDIARQEADKPVFGKDWTKEKSEETILGLKKKYGDNFKQIENIHRELRAYLDDLQQYRVDTGLISKELKDTLDVKYPNYVPTYRQNEMPEQMYLPEERNPKIWSGLQTATGGEAPIENLYSQIVDITRNTIRAGEQNQMFDIFAKTKGITPSKLSDSVTAEDIAEIIPTAETKNNKYKIKFYRDGEYVSIPVDRQIYEGFREMNGDSMALLLNNWGTKILSKYFMRPFKGLITDWNVFFGVRNGARDYQQAVVNSKDAKMFLASAPSATRAIASKAIGKPNAFYNLYASNGGKYANLVDIGKTLGQYIDPSTGKRVLSKIKGSTLDKLEAINGAIETMPRLGEFIGTIKKDANKILKEQNSSLSKLYDEVKKSFPDSMVGEGKKFTDEADRLDAIEDEFANRIVDIIGKTTVDRAIKNSAEITLNFSRSGVLGKLLNTTITPYLNPSIQGLSRLGRLFSEGKADKQLLPLLCKICTFTILPSAFNEIMLSGNEDYKNLSTRDKDNNYFIPLWDGKFIKIPRPRELAVINEPVQYALRYLLDNAEYGGIDDFMQMFKTAGDNIGVINPFAENLFSPILRIKNNKTWYGGKIESTYEEDAYAPKDRYDETTSSIGIKLGQTPVAQALNLSPKKIDNIIDSYTGVVGDILLPATAEASKGNSLWNVSVGQFVTDSVFRNKLSTTYWDKYSDVKWAANGKQMSKKAFEKANKNLSEFESNTFWDISLLSRAMADIDTSKMTDKQKLAAKREIRIEQNKLYRAGIDNKPTETNIILTIGKALDTPKVNGMDKALSKYTYGGDDGNDYTQLKYKNFKTESGYNKMTLEEKKKASKDFCKVYFNAKKVQNRIDGNTYDCQNHTTIALTTAMLEKNGKISKKRAKQINTAYDVYDETADLAKAYVKSGGNLRTYTVTMKGKKNGINKILENNPKVSSSARYNLAMVLADNKKVQYRDLAYVLTECESKMNASRCLTNKKYGWSANETSTLATKIPSSKNGQFKKTDIVDTIEKSRAKTREEKAALFELYSSRGTRNPYGTIGDYSLKTDTGIEIDSGSSSGGGRGRGGYGHHGGGGSSSKGDWFNWYDSNINVAKSTKSKSTKDNTSKSALDEAYRKRLRSYIKKAR